MSAFNLFHRVGFYNIAFVNIVEVLNAYAAFITGSNLADIVLEPAQRCNLTFMNNHAVANNANLRIALNLAVLNVCTRNRADGADLERVSDAYCTQMHFFEYGLEHTLHSVFNIFNRLINDAVGADIDLFLLRKIARSAVGTDIEADYDRV